MEAGAPQPSWEMNELQDLEYTDAILVTRCLFFLNHETYGVGLYVSEANLKGIGEIRVMLGILSLAKLTENSMFLLDGVF